MNFKKMTFEDIDILREYFVKYNTGYNNSTLGGFFAWREWLNAEYAIDDNTLYMRITNKEGKVFYSMPFGDDKEKALIRLNEYINNNKSTLRFTSILEDEFPLLDKLYDYEVKIVGRGDYIYDFNSLKTLSGRKLHGQKNHLNYFIKNYDKCRIVEVTSENAKDLIGFISKVKNVTKESSANMYQDELKYNVEVLNNFSVYKYDGIIALNDNEIIGFVIGEEIKDTAFMHIMKIDKSFRGVAQYLITKYLSGLRSDLKYVNMEDDAGDEDLRYTKTCYHPIKIQDINNVEVNRCKF